MIRRLLLAGPILALAACAHTPETGDDGLSFAERQQRLVAISNWDLRGDLIVDTGERRERVRVVWEQRGGELSLTVRGIAIGAGAFRISGTNEEITIEGRRETRVLADPERDLSRELGWWLPVTSLEHWLLGRPDTAFPAQTTEDRSRKLSSIDQRDWTIAYDEYQLIDGVLIPRSLRMQHAPLELRLTVNEWTPAGS